MPMYKIRAGLLCALLFAGTLSAETFRVGNMHVLSLSSGETVSAGLNDAVAVQLTGQREYLMGIDIELKVPPELMEFFDSTAYMVYSQVTPEPAEGVIDYSGTRVHTDILPVKLSTTLRMAVENESIQSTPYETILPVTIAVTDTFVFIRFQQVMKGIPDEIMKSKIMVSAKPVFKDIGELKLSLSYPETQTKPNPYTIFIDDAPATVKNNSAYLATGIHHLAVVSDYYRNEVRTFNIEQAKTTNLSIALQEIVSTLRVIAPETAVVELDGNSWEKTDKAVSIEPGNHIIRFTVGDYEAEKTFTVINGKSYVLSLLVDIQITENP